MDHQEIDLKKIKAIQARFTQLSNARLERTLGGFNFSQSDSIKLLPLLFHVNHPMLPGYVDKSTPCGLPNYFPSKLEKKIAKTVSRSFKYQSRAYLKFDIAALFLMGSTGTLAQSTRSDLDLWVCLAEQPEAGQFSKLQKKALLISQWMESIGVELHCYFVHQDDFSLRKRKTLTKENCGDTQNFLLLDEFYRTAIWLCGRMPLWWLIAPGENYQTKAFRLIKEKHVDESDWIDFGEIAEIPANEYFSAALWQLYKAIESPYKSSVKLLILEIYARHFPKTGLLSSQYKSLVYQGVDQIEKLDPYLMILQYAEEFLEKQPKRLEFLRRAFYLKAGSKVDLKKANKLNWRYQQLLQLVKQWGWKQPRLDYLNDRPNWRINAVVSERDDLLRELNHSYHFLSNFARVQGVLDKVSQNELLSLGRKLYAVFERRAGKVDQVNNGIAKDVAETSVTLYQKNTYEWSLILGAVTKEQLAFHQPVHRAQSFFEVLAWCVCNRVTDQHTNYQVYAEDEFFNHRLASEIVKALINLVVGVADDLADSKFDQPAKTVKLGIYLNTESDPFAEEKNKDIYNVIDQVDWFCWGENSTNLLSQFDIFYVNSWGEYSCKSYRGDFAWIQLLDEHSELLVCEKDSLLFLSDNVPGKGNIKQRVQYLFERWYKLKTASQLNTNRYSYLMSSGSGILKIDFSHGLVSYKLFKQVKRFLYSLSEPSDQITEYIVDDNLRLSHSLKWIIGKPPPSENNCYFIQNKSNSFEVVVTEPGGNVFYQTHQGVGINNLISHYQQFFDSINHRSGLLVQEVKNCYFWQFHVAAGSSGGRFHLIKPDSGQIADHYTRIQAIATRNSENKICYDIYTGEHAYCYRDYGDLVYRKMAQFIRGQRIDQQSYPIFITDLDLSTLNHQPQLIEYFEHKRSIEQKLNRAMSQLSNLTN